MPDFAEPLARLITEFKRLPGIGQKSAQRLAFHVLRASRDDAEHLAQAILDVKDKLGLCRICNNIAASELCQYCSDSSRERESGLRGGGAAQHRRHRKGARVSELVLAEATWMLARFYKLSSLDLANAIEMLLHHRDLVIQDSETVAGALELFRAKPALGFSDCLMLQLARKAGHLPLGTFDRDLAKVEGTQKL